MMGGMDLNDIDYDAYAAAATKLWLTTGPEKFTIRELAKQLKVGPTTIHAHFKGVIRDLRREIARRALEDLTPPYQPNQTPKDYLRAFMRSALLVVSPTAHSRPPRRPRADR